MPNAMIDAVGEQMRMMRPVLIRRSSMSVFVVVLTRIATCIKLDEASRTRP